MNSVSNFNESLERVKQGKSVFVIPTKTRCTVIKSKHIEQWEEVGKKLIQPEDSGYRLMTGKTSVFIFGHQLKEESI